MTEVYIDDSRCVRNRRIYNRLISEDIAYAYDIANKIGDFLEERSLLIPSKYRNKAIELGVKEISWEQMACMLYFRNRGQSFGDPVTVCQRFNYLRSRPVKIVGSSEGSVYINTSMTVRLQSKEYYRVIADDTHLLIDYIKHLQGGALIIGVVAHVDPKDADILIKNGVKEISSEEFRLLCNSLQVDQD